MDRTLLRNLQKPPALDFRKISNQRKLYFDCVGELELAIARRTIVQIDPAIAETNPNIFERPPLSVRIHSQSDAHARPKRRQQQFIRVRSNIPAARLNWLVGLEHMVAH
jgi:hypothetical protein